MDGSGTINPAALNTPGKCLLCSCHNVRVKRASQSVVVVVMLPLPQRCYIRHWRPHCT
jgi:hypothetical protein